MNYLQLRIVTIGNKLIKFYVFLTHINDVFSVPFGTLIGFRHSILRKTQNNSYKMESFYPTRKNKMENHDNQLLLSSSSHGAKHSLILRKVHTENGMVVGFDGNSTADKIMSVMVSV